MRVASVVAVLGLPLACAAGSAGAGEPAAAPPEPTPTASVEVAEPPASARPDETPPPPREAPAPPESCEAPDQPGCNPCCIARGDGRCVVRAWQTGGVDVSGIEPWYNSSKSVDTCPEGCRPCARCDRRARRAIESLEQHPECDCSEPIGVDPCFVRGSCECYCSTATSLAQRCPDAIEVPGMK